MAQTIVTGAEGAFADRIHSQTASRTHSLPPIRLTKISSHVAFVRARILAGLDRSFHLPVKCEIYLAPVLACRSLTGGHRLMPVVRVVELSLVS